MAKSPENNSHDSGDESLRDSGRSGHDREHSRFTRLLKTASQGSPDVDAAFLEKLEQESTQAFLASHTVHTDLDSHKAERCTVKEHNQLETTSTSMTPKRTIMTTTFVTRALAAMLAGMIAWFGWSLMRPNDDTLGAALDRTAASSLQLQLTQANLTYDVFAIPGKIRLNSAATQYQIGNNEKTWLIDESVNRAQTGPPRHFDEEGKLNLLSLLGDIPAHEFSAIRNLKPAGEAVSFNGFECRRYETPVNCGYGRCIVVAHVEIQSGLLRQLELLPPDNLADRGVARLNLVQYGEPLDENLFAISDKLTPAGRVGKIAGYQGLVSLRPVMHRRWSLASQNMQLEVGDQLRTGPHGANAVDLQLKNQANVLVGPGSIVEMAAADSVRLVSGEMRVKVPEGGSVSLNGPGNETVEAKETAVYRVIVKDGKQILSRLENTPRWIGGFEGTSNYDPTGSLIATIDGRNVPLTVGYHKVSVDIRDQIARTEIEQSFVNHTDSQLEGVFYFPLPQDASISGFGMWINGELVEADVVEKQRALEIYETILREKRDPGLLEWTGGNIFKARVFPIFGNSEKRIKITYTQVLPRRGNRYVYQYGLQSEMLRQNPLRDLSISLKINSAVKLANVNCPTHATRDSQTANSAVIEFSAQEYTPERDFEVTVDVQDGAPPVVVTPHRRGDDGYFMLQLTPPASSGGWQSEDPRGLTAEGEPLQILIIADTSASMNENARSQQLNLVTALLALLSPADRVNVVAADVEPVWQYDDWHPAGQQTADESRDWLAARDSLGWTDLERTFESVLSKVGKNTQVVYVGDGMVSTYVADGVEFANRLKRMFGDNQSTLHAISVGSSYEAVVLKGIGSLGGGSLRQVSGSRTPESIAADLLSEIARPVLRDLKVEFDGLRVARVYPESLPNLSDGQQQILLGRYLPQGNEQQGTVRISGMLADTPVSWSAPLKLADAETGNSFIPRLWARMHLDYLLNQGSSQAIQDQIIRLSEEFHIITPYTSLLVLESDEDRERFGVKRRFGMRDGERFFADGRDNANYELLQQQMKLAGNWRIGLQMQLLRYFATLGRAPLSASVQQGQQADWSTRSYAGYGVGGGGGGGRGGGGQFGGYAGTPFSVSKKDMFYFEDRDSNGLPMSGRESFESIRPSRLNLFERGDRRAFNKQRQIRQSWWGSDENESLVALEAISSLAGDQLFDFEQSEGFRNQLGYQEEMSQARYGRRPVGGVFVSGEINGRYESNMFLPARTKRPYGYPPSSQIANLFPGFSDFEKSADKPPADWPEEVRLLAQRVMRGGALSQIDGGFEVEETSKFYDDRRGNEYSRSNERTLYSPTAWLRQKSDSGNQTIVDWLAGSIRSVVLGGYELGRRRVATPTDKQINPFTGHHEAFERLVKTHESWTARLEDKDDRRDLRRRGAQNDDQKLLILTSDSGQTKEILIDTRRNIVLSVVDKDREGKTTLTRSFRDFVNIGGIWWALNRETKNADGYVQRETLVSVRQLDQPKFDAALVRHTPEADRVLFIEDDPRRTLRSATQSIADRRATIADHVLRLDWFMSQQRWPKAWTELETIARMAGARKGLAWLQLETQFASRKFEEMRQLLTKLAEETTAMPDANSDNQFFLATRLQNKFHQLQVGERLDLHRLLKPAFTNSLIPAIGSRHWDESLSSYLEQSSERVAALKIRQQLAQKYPYDVSIQKQYINGLFQQGQRGDAFEWLERVISRGPNPENKEFVNPDASRWLDSEYTDLIRFKLNRLSEDGRYQEMLPICEELIAAENEKQLDQSVYDYFVAALVQTDQVEKVDQLIADWLSEAKTSKRDQPNVSRPAGERSKRARIRVALQYALGDNQNSSRTLEPKWVEPLATLVRDTSGNESPHEFARTVLNHHRFQKLDINSTIRRELMERLEQDLDSLSPAMISFYFSFGSSQVADKAQWQRLAERLQRRWESELEKLRIAITNLDAESTAENRRTKTQLESDAQSLGNTLESIYANVGAVERLKFLRQRIELATSENQRTLAAHSLFNSLVSATWTVENENETFDLLGQLIDTALTDKPRGRLSRVNALYLWTAAMNRGRRAHAIDSIAGADEMVPTELLDKQKKAVEDAAAEFIAMLAQKETDDATPDWWKKWLQIERHYYEVRQKQNYDEVQATCREILGDQPRIFVPDVDDQDAVAAATLDAALQQRSLKMLLFLGSMGKATDEQREWMGRYIDRGLKISVDDVTLYEKETSEEPKTDEEKRAAEYRLDLRKNFIDEAVTQAASDWKMTKYQWMITTDQTDELISTLQSWAAVDDGVKTWRHALALLQAERGEIESAIKHFETIENTGELLAGDYRTLANWYLVMDRRDDYERAKLESLNATQEWELRNYISQATSHVQNTSGVPEDLNENVFIAIRSLMARARNVHSHDWSVRQLYRATRDFRVLAALADSMVGHSARGIYPQLRAWNETVEEIRDEATVDSILERIDELRKTKQTTTDLRALDLLESIIERRASKLENQPGPHIVRAVEALNRAFARDWEAGERVLMAQLLLILGNVENNELRTTQLAQLDDLLAAEPDPANEFGFSNRLHIAHARAQLIAQYGERQRAIDDLTRELNDYIKATGEPFPQDVLAALASLVEFHKQLRQCAAAEELLQRFLPVATESQRGWLNTNLNELYLYALDNEGLVSLGSGKAIYANLHDYLLSQLNESVSEERRYQAINFICRFFDTACREHINEAKSDLRKFAFEQIPVELKKITNRYGDTVRQVASKLHDHLGAVDCVRFYVERYEQQPPRVRRNNALDLNYVGNWVRDNASLPAELDERLLTIVVDHLKRELQTMESQNLYLYRKNYHDFWAKHAATYLETANEVWRQNRDSGAHAAFISEYVYHGLENRDRAIEILLDAYQRELLEDNYQSQLVTYLQSRDRFDESIEILVQLIESHPNNVDYYVRLMNAYYKTNQKENLQTTWESADKNFNIKRFDSRPLEALANGCIDTGLYQAATEYLDRLIEAHPKGQPDGAATFSRLNQQLSRAHIELGNLQPALDAANAAIVSWGANVDSRSDALASLTAVINAVEAGKFESDLDGLVELADKQAAETGQFNYLLRKAIGDAYQQNGQFKRAITQLQLAVELQPNDPEIHNALIACYDGAKDESGAVLQLFELTRLNRRDVDLYKRLAERLADSQFRESYPGGTERAYTSIVEMLPAESEGHAALAEIRQSQNRWDAAARHWNRVAEIRAKEPTGLVKLCEAQIHLGQWGEAERTLQQLKAKTWPERFNDVENQIQKLGKLINNRSKS